MDDKIVVKYRSQRNYCPCCEQKLAKPETTKPIKFELSKKNIMEADDWEEFIEDGELRRVVRDYVTSTISFFATPSRMDRIIVDDSEIEKVEKYILSEVKGGGNT